MIQTLESRRLLSALPVTHAPVEEPTKVRIVSLEEFLGMEHWDGGGVVIESYRQPPRPADGTEADDWWYELEEDMSDGVCDGPQDAEPLDDQDFALVAESEVLEAPIAISAGDDAAMMASFSDVGSIAEEVLEANDDEDDMLA